MSKINLKNINKSAKLYHGSLSKNTEKDEFVSINPGQHYYIDGRPVTLEEYIAKLPKNAKKIEPVSLCNCVFAPPEHTPPCKFAQSPKPQECKCFCHSMDKKTSNDMGVSCSHCKPQECKHEDGLISNLSGIYCNSCGIKLEIVDHFSKTQCECHCHHKMTYNDKGDLTEANCIVDAPEPTECSHCTPSQCKHENSCDCGTRHFCPDCGEQVQKITPSPIGWAEELKLYLTSAGDRRRTINFIKGLLSQQRQSYIEKIKKLKTSDVQCHKSHIDLIKGYNQGLDKAIKLLEEE